MKPQAPVDDGREDLCRSRLDGVISPSHERVQLTKAITGLVSMRRFDEAFGESHCDKGRPALAMTLIGGPLIGEPNILKYMHRLSGLKVCAHWEENPHVTVTCSKRWWKT